MEKGVIRELITLDFTTFHPGYLAAAPLQAIPAKTSGTWPGIRERGDCHSIVGCVLRTKIIGVCSNTLPNLTVS
jgi:hypothetical protein